MQPVILSQEVTSYTIEDTVFIKIKQIQGTLLRPKLELLIINVYSNLDKYGLKIQNMHKTILQK